MEPELRCWKRVVPLLLGAAMLGGCVTSASSERSKPPWADSGQMVVVVSADWNADHGELRRYERAGQAWRSVGDAVPVTIGRSGAAWGIGLHASPSGGPVKREGDGRSPAGVFAIGDAFGYPAQVETGLPYRAMKIDDWCVDVSGSPLYNRIVSAEEVGAEQVKGSTEPMRRDLHVEGDQRYRIGFVVEHNAAGADMGGSCIFAHVWKSPADATSGCTAMSDQDMRALLGWLRRESNPRFVLLPQSEYSRLRADWRLP